MAKFLMQWEAPEFEYREKDVSWYWILVIAAAAIVAFSVVTRNFLFGFFITVAGILLIVWGNRTPREIPFTLDDQGIMVDGRRYHELREFESWSTAPAGDPFADLYLNFRSRVRPALKVLLPGDRVDELRADLKGVLKEVEHEPSLLDAIEKILRF
ncbi:MAG TPA: hypothetical protein VMT99_01955 [Candidatus Paceibacterota bacterium]|nr:hypothetical protein [Candidatus Paceibacterota bacterium]